MDKEEQNLGMDIEVVYRKFKKCGYINQTDTQTKENIGHR